MKNYQKLSTLLNNFGKISPEQLQQLAQLNAEKQQTREAMPEYTPPANSNDKEIEEYN